MTENTPFSVGVASGWQLRAEFWATSWLGDGRQLADQVTETMGELGLPPGQLERIQMALLEAVQRAPLREQTVLPLSPIHIRIWFSCDCSRGRGCGFFLVEKPGCDSREGALGTERLIELFLYQERDS